MIKHGKYLNESIYRMGIFFFVVGIITVYFDFLTYPLVTLGIPLAYWLMAREEWRKENGARQPRENIGKTLGRIIACSAFWSAGYLGMWVGKWTIASFLLKQNIFLDAFRQILLHTSDSADYTKWDCIWLQMEVLARWPYLIIFGGILIGILIINRRKIKDAIVHMNCTFLSILPYLFLATYPFVWYLVASGHCYANPKFTFRILGITVFAGFLGILSCFRQENADRE